MTLLGLGPRRRSLEDTNVPLSSNRILDALGITKKAAGVHVSETSAYALTAYYRAVVLTAGTIAQLPLKVYRDGTRDEVQMRTVLGRPNPRQTEFEFRFTFFANALSWGNGLAWKVRDRSSIVTETWPIHPSRVRIEEADRTPTNPEGKVFIYRRGDGTESLHTAWDVLHLPFLSPNGLSGLSPVQAFAQPLGVALAAERQAAEFYGNFSIPPGLLTTDAELLPEEGEEIRKSFKQRMAASEAGDVPVLYGGLRFEALSIPPADAQLLESRRFGVSEVARMFGVPPHLLADVDKSTSWGTGIEQQTLAWLKFGLGTWLAAGEQRFTYDLLPGGPEGDWFAEFLTDGLLRGDSQARAQSYASAIQWGYMNRAEVRRKENLPGGPPELDEFLTPLNMETAGGDDSPDVMELTRALQQIYLAVGTVVTVDEAREIANRLGAGLPVPGMTGGEQGDSDDDPAT